MKVEIKTGGGGIARPDGDIPVFAQLVAIIDQGDVQDIYNGKARSRHMATFVFAGYQKASGDKLSRDPLFIITESYNLVLSEKSNLQKMLVGWGVKIDADLDLHELIGRNAKLKVENVDKEDKTYTNILSVAVHELLPPGSVTVMRFPWMEEKAKGPDGLKGNLTEYIPPEEREGYVPRDEPKVPAAKAQPPVSGGSAKAAPPKAAAAYDPFAD